MTDMSHISGLVAAGLSPSNPFDFCDIVTSTVHKTLRGPRAALLFYRKNSKSFPQLPTQVSNSVFPGHLGGPHNHTISAVATCLKEAATEEYKEYQQQVILNSKELGERLMSKGYFIMTGGTDNHMLLVNLRDQSVYGDQLYNLMDQVDITINKYNVKGTPHTSRPDGMRVGSPAMTTRGCGTEEFSQIADIIDETVRLTRDLSVKGESLAEFDQRVVHNPTQAVLTSLGNLKTKVNRFSEQFYYNFEMEDL